MKSMIYKVNYKLGRAIFIREDGEYGWFEILDTIDLESEEIVYGNFLDLGRTTIRKQSGETVDIFIEDFCSPQLATECVFPRNK